MLFFDYASTAPPDEELYNKAFALAQTAFANPSSRHQAGIEAKNTIEELRRRAAAVLDVPADTLTFNSGATEGNQFIMLSQLAAPGRGVVLVNESEHDAVYENFFTLKKFGFTVKSLPNDSCGRLTPETLLKRLSDDTRLVAVMLVNNETGAVNDIAALNQALRGYERQQGLPPVHLHVDATQALGKIDFNLQTLGCDSAVFSAHKAGAPRGGGLLYLKKPRPAFLKGGGQEHGLRSGTENLLAIAGMTFALEKYYKTRCPLIPNGFIIKELQKLGALILPPGREAHPNYFIPYIINCAFPPLPGEVVVRALSKRGVYISTGSACASNKKKNLRPLTAAGIDSSTAAMAVRFSYGAHTPAVSAEEMLAILKEVLQALRF
jgi:cysteine desulfurase